MTGPAEPPLTGPARPRDGARGPSPGRPGEPGPGCTVPPPRVRDRPLRRLSRSPAAPPPSPGPHRSGSCPRPGRRNRPQSSPWRRGRDPPPRAPAHVITPRQRGERATGGVGGGARGRGWERGAGRSSLRRPRGPSAYPRLHPLLSCPQLLPAAPSCPLDSICSPTAAPQSPAAALSYSQLLTSYSQLPTGFSPVTLQLLPSHPPAAHQLPPLAP